MLPESTELIPNILYSPKVINDIIFRPGEYIQFNETGNYLNYVSRGLDKRFYKLKLYQQLTSGLLDLTQDIENVYTTFGGTEDFWILDSAFKYYCPFLYKGKLMLSLEMEPLLSCKITSFPTLSFLDNKYSVSVNVEVIYNVGDNCIYVPSLVISSNIDGITITPTYDTTTPGTLLATIIFSEIPSSLTNEIFNFTISPYYEWLVGAGTSTEEDIGDLPTQFTDQYILNGSVFLTNEVFDIDFPLEVAKQYGSTVNVCSVDEADLGYRIYNELYLTNILGDLLDYNLELTETPHVVVLQGETKSNTEHTLLGYFTKDVNGNINSISSWNSDITIAEDIKQAINTKLATINIRVEDSSCSKVELNLLVVGNSDVSITVFQSDLQISETKTGNTNMFLVSPNTPITIQITPDDRDTYEDIIVATLLGYE